MCIRGSCTPCFLFDASQLITLPVDCYSLSASLNGKHNYPVGAVLKASLPAVTRGSASFVLHTFPCVQMSSAHLGAPL